MSSAACGYQGFGSGDNPSGPGCVKPKGHDGPCGTSAAQDRELRLRTIKGVKDLLSSAGSMSPERDAISVESNGYSLWLVPYDPQPMSTAPISDEEILRRIEAREALNDGK